MALRSYQTASRHIWLALATAALVVTGCGYHSISSYLDHIDTIRIPRVRNQTTLFELEEELTGELLRQFGVQWNDGNDSLLAVSIFDYTIDPLRYDINNLPEQYRMSLRVSYEFHDNVRNRLIASEDEYDFYRDFYVVTGRGEAPEDELTARANLLDELVQSLYNKLATRW
ncbi:MAG: LPS assembly lipoprotein LptE [Candidatus Poribacteria bacterium]